MAKKEKTYIEFPLHATKGEKKGWGGIDLAEQEDNLGTHVARDTLNFTNRLGLKGDNIGVLATRPGIASGPKYEMHNLTDSTCTANPERFKVKWYPDPSISAGGEVVRLVGGSFQKFNPATGGWNDLIYCADQGGGPVNDLLFGSAGHPAGGYYPQHIIFDVPSGPWFCWVDLENGLYVYDGAVVTKVNIPKKSNAAVSITGALWLAQIDAMLIVSGNWVDLSETDVVYYCKTGDPTEFSSLEGGGAFEAWGVSSRGGDTPPKRITGLAELGRSLLVFAEDMRYIWINVGTKQADRSIEPGMGCASGKTICSWKGNLFWVGKDDIYMWSRGEPRPVGQRIWNKFGTIQWGDGAGNPLFHQFHSFIYEDQYWFNFRSSDQPGNHVNTNWIFDLIRGDWYISDIPIGCAFDSKGGMDLGALFFASAKNYNTAMVPQYQSFRYGYDDSNPSGGSPQIFADIWAPTTGGVRAAHHITAEWETGRLHFGDPLMGKEYHALLVRLGLTPAGGDYTPTFAGGYARVYYELDDNLKNHTMNFPSTETEIDGQPFHYLGITDDKPNKGHFIKIKWQIKTNNFRVAIKKAYVQMSELAHPLWHPR